MSIFDVPLKSKAISRRYPDFNAAYIKKVEEAQKIVSDAENFKRPYMIVAEVLEELALKNAGGLTIQSECLQAKFEALTSDTKAHLDECAKKIGTALMDASLHGNGKPSVGYGQIWPAIHYNWHVGDDMWVTLLFDLPFEGIEDIQCVRREMATTVVRWEYVDNNGDVIA